MKKNLRIKKNEIMPKKEKKREKKGEKKRKNFYRRKITSGPE